MMSIDSLEVQPERIVVRGKLLKNMPTVIHLQPVGLAELVMLLTFKSAMKLAVMFCKGMWQYARGIRSEVPVKARAGGPGRP